MGYFPEKLFAGQYGMDREVIFDGLDGDGVAVMTVRTTAEYEDDLAISEHVCATWNACAGIDAAHLWPGAMVEMVDVIQKMAEGKIVAGQARAILAKLGKV